MMQPNIPPLNHQYPQIQNHFNQQAYPQKNMQPNLVPMPQVQRAPLVDHNRTQPQRLPKLSEVMPEESAPRL